MQPIHRGWRARGWRPRGGWGAGAPLVGALVGLVVGPAGAIAQTPAQAREDAPAPLTAFVGVNVVPMDRERVLTDQTVLVRGDRIVTLGPTTEVPVPAGAMRVDGKGKFLIPGLADMHAHVYANVRPPADDSDASKAMYFYVANGITTIRIMNGSPEALQLRGRTARGEIVGPRIYSTTPSIYENYSPAEAVRIVEHAKDSGYDFVKLYAAGATRDSAVTVARRVGLRVLGHVPRPPERGVERALAVPYASIEHLTGYIEDLLGRAGRWDSVAISRSPWEAPVCCQTDGCQPAHTWPGS